METLLTLTEVLIFIIVSGICSGLNLSLMSLDVSDLERKARYGNKRAKRVLPLRRNSHLSLASILLTNVAVVSATSLTLESRFNGLIAGIASTFLIVIFGEILPQALFMKQALKITSTFATVLRWMIILTYPAAKPIQLLLDKLFGLEHSKLHSRHELGMIIADHLGSDKSELDEMKLKLCAVP